MLEVIIIGSHIGQSGAWWSLTPPFNAFLWLLFPDGLQNDFQLINHLWLRLELTLLVQHGAQTWSDSPVGSNLDSLRATDSSQWTRDSSLIQTVLRDVQNEGFRDLNLHKIVIFRHILAKVGDSVYILLFNSCVKFSSKICTKVEGIVSFALPCR